ncbi:MAG: alpha-amylase family glycosyl hydrolase [Hyphomonas sp.]|uniref:alpha-amylase family glycosyl hydrolase n=1 Tax=Hyphomonas sp. TaxID=87 RepID=UPI0035288ED7
MIRSLIPAVLIASLAACTSRAPAPEPATITFAPQPYVQLTHADWAKDAVIYQINTRQFTTEGTFAAAQRELPRLKELGVDILWLMPIHPIGEKHRKGTLGSPYAVKDYYGVNPEFGTVEDLKAFVDAAHALGMHVILDWVANHTAADNPLTTEHPDWYETDWKGDFHPTPWTDWYDIIDLDYSQPGLREYMTGAMEYWVRDVGIDGYRCDVAGYVPLDFWETLRGRLDAIKPVFMLAEWDTRDLHQHAFDATYAWDWKEAAHAIAQGHSDAGRMTSLMQRNLGSWPRDAYKMMYTENHDQNAWEGTPREFYGDALPTFMALQFVMDGIQVIHNGQEAGNEHRLAFFEKDPIVWRDHPQNELIRKLIRLKKENPALWNGAAGGEYEPIVTDNGSQIVSFARRKDGNTVIALFNLSARPASFTLTDGPVDGTYTDFATAAEMSLSLASAQQMMLPAWGFHVLVSDASE